MNINDLREKIESAIHDAGSEFYFSLKSKDVIHIKRADVDQLAQNDLQEGFIDSLLGETHQQPDRHVIDLSKADSRSNAIYRYDLDPSQDGHLKAIVAPITIDDITKFTFDKDNLSYLDAIIAVIGHDKERIVIYQHNYPVNLIKKDGFSLIRLQGNNERLTKVNSDIIRITFRIDIIYVDGSYFIFNLKTFEKYFHFQQVIKNEAKKGIETIISCDLVEDIEPMRRRLDDTTFNKKLVRATKDSVVLKNIPAQTIIDFIKSQPKLSRKIKTNKIGNKLILETKVSQDFFLKILNDDYLFSELTKRHYESLAKDEI